MVLTKEPKPKSKYNLSEFSSNREAARIVIAFHDITFSKAMKILKIVRNWEPDTPFPEEAENVQSELRVVYIRQNKLLTISCPHKLKNFFNQLIGTDQYS